MKETELRIGNLLEYTNKVDNVHFTSYRKVNSIDFLADIDNDRYGYIVNGVYLEEYTPIPITDDWLLDFGFEKKLKGKYFDNDAYIISIDDLKYTVSFKEEEWRLFNGISDAYCNMVNNAQLKYIHQLQNLYFAITGIELVFNHVQ